jgi:predicted lactoylglutathione lyase
MLDHTGVTVTDLGKAKTFYEAALSPLGLKVILDKDRIAGFGQGHLEFMIVKGESPHHAHVSFTAPSKEAVDTFYAKAVEAGGLDNGAPGYRKNIAPGHYAAFVHDFDGHNIEAVFHDPNPSE